MTPEVKAKVAAMAARLAGREGRPGFAARAAEREQLAAKIPTPPPASRSAR